MLRMESETGWWLITHPDHARLAGVVGWCVPIAEALREIGGCTVGVFHGEYLRTLTAVDSRCQQTHRREWGIG